MDENKLNIELEELNLEDGGFLVIKSDNISERKELLEAIKVFFESKGFTNMAVMIVKEHEDVYQLSEKTMNELGWYKIEYDDDTFK